MNLAQRYLALTGAPCEGMWQAPGRVNLIGEHTDYNGGLALPFALDRRTEVAAGRRVGDRRIRCWSAQMPSPEMIEVVDATGVPVTQEPSSWSRYPAGVVWAFGRLGIDLPGMDLVMDSSVPVGSGLSSSASILAACAVAIDDLAETALGRSALAEVCHEAESGFVGAPVGHLDQLAVFHARPGHALLIDFDTMALRHVPLPDQPVVVVDTGVRHDHASGAYGDRRRDCEAAAAALGVTHLRQATMASVESTLDGRLLRRARHVVSEDQRVEELVGTLARGAAPGDVFYSSHRSLRDDFEVSCPELDLVVDTAASIGAPGARMTGGGFGGCAIVVGVAEAEVAAAVSRAFTGQGRPAPKVFAVLPSGGAGRC